MSGWLLPFRHAEPHGWFVVGGLCAIPFLKINKTGCHPVCRAKTGLIYFKTERHVAYQLCIFFRNLFLSDQFQKLVLKKSYICNCNLFKNLITITIE